MNKPKKPNANSVLQTLPADRQSHIIELMDTGSIEATRKQLAADGLKVSAGALSDFYSWWQTRQVLNKADARAEAWMDRLRKEEPTMPEAKVFRMGQMMFSLLAVEQQDNLGWSRIQREQSRKESVGILKKNSQRRFIEEFKKWVKDQKVKEILGGDDSSDAKTEALGRQIFKEDWD